MSHRPNSDVSTPKSIIPHELIGEFHEWVRDGGYDESYLNRWDSKSRALEETFLEERNEICPPTGNLLS